MITRQHDPHPERKPYPIVRPRVGNPIRFTCLTRKEFGLDTHYGCNGTFACTCDDSCVACRGGNPARYQGYVIGKGSESGVIAVIHLTSNATAQMVSRRRENLGLLGMKVCLSRKGPNENGEVEACVYGFDDGDFEIQDRNLVEIIHAIYRQKLNLGNLD